MNNKTLKATVLIVSLLVLSACGKQPYLSDELLSNQEQNCLDTTKSASDCK